MSTMVSYLAYMTDRGYKVLLESVAGGERATEGGD